MISPSSRDFNHIIDSVDPTEKAIEALRLVSRRALYMRQTASLLAPEAWIEIIIFPFRPRRPLKNSE